MSYKCYNCGKKFDEDIESCDRCGAKKVKFSSNKIESNNDEIKYYSFSLLPVFVIVNIISLVLASVDFPNIQYIISFTAVALASAGIARLMYPTSKLIYYIFYGEVYMCFWIVIAFYLLIKNFIKLLIGR